VLLLQRRVIDFWRDWVAVQKAYRKLHGGKKFNTLYPKATLDGLSRGHHLIWCAVPREATSVS
jgi:hypothetical protein